MSLSFGNPFNLQAKGCKIRLTVHCFADTVSDFYPNDSHFSVSTWNIGAKASCASFFLFCSLYIKENEKKDIPAWRKANSQFWKQNKDTKISCWLIHGYRYNKELHLQQRVIRWLHEDFVQIILLQSYEIKSPSWTILWFRILGIFSVENIARLGVFMFQTSDNSQLCIDPQYSSQ